MISIRDQNRDPNFMRINQEFLIQEITAHANREIERIKNENKKLLSHSKKCLENLRDSMENGWKSVQANSRPDESFRAMLNVMEKWIDYLESVREENSGD